MPEAFEETLVIIRVLLTIFFFELLCVTVVAPTPVRERARSRQKTAKVLRK